MEAPSLVLVPSSPLTETSSPALSSSKDNSPVSSDSSHTRPPSSYGISIEEPGRNSSESTIFSIYSMYSERRQTWRKSTLANTAFPGIDKEPKNESSEGGRASVPATDDGRGSGSIADSFYRAPVSRQSSNGSGFLSGSAEGSSRPQSSLRGHSRPTSRHAGALLNRNSTELPYPDSNSLPNLNTHLATNMIASTAPGDASTIGRMRGAQTVSSWGKYVDLSLTDEGQPDLNLHRYSPAFGKTHDSPRSTTAESNEKSNETWEKPARPPRGSPPIAHAHGKTDSTSTSGHFGAVSSNTSMYGLESLSATHEGYVTAPESVESAGSHFTPSGRFRITNPGPAPSPSPPPISTRSSLQKSLPAKPSSTNSVIPSSISHAKRKSIVSSTPPTRPSTGTGTSSAASSARDSGKPTEGEEPEAYFVRNTYAQLDTTGVKGDGYEEGIERTRAKLGHDRQSVQLAAINDAKEEARGDVPTKELELLGSLDRYGFFVVPSHDRLVLLTSVSLAKPLQYFPQSINSGPPSPPALSSIPEHPPVSKARETRRIAKWERMLEAEQRDRGGNVSLWRVRASKERKLRERVFKGIPDRWRAAAWEVLVGRWVSAHRKESLDAQRLLNVLENLRSEYRSSLERPSSYDVQIDLDVPRTINGHVLFKTRYGQGQRSLFHTLHSFSLTCEDCGYCQGMGPLAATLLCYYEPEKVYATLVHFHDEYQLHDIFLPGFPGLLEAIYIQERILEKMMPGVYASFKKHMVSTTSYATKWYITLFANSVPFQTQLRLWDAFLLEGRDVFVITAIAIVWVLKDYLTSNQANFETILSLLSSFFVPENEDSLLKWIERALDDKKLREDMAHWRVEWHQLVADKKEGSALL